MPITLKPAQLSAVRAKIGICSIKEIARGLGAQSPIEQLLLIGGGVYWWCSR
jgi:hypothetical protein